MVAASGSGSAREAAHAVRDEDRRPPLARRGEVRAERCPGTEHCAADDVEVRQLRRGRGAADLHELAVRRRARRRKPAAAQREPAREPVDRAEVHEGPAPRRLPEDRDRERLLCRARARARSARSGRAAGSERSDWPGTPLHTACTERSDGWSAPSARWAARSCTATEPTAVIASTAAATAIPAATTSVRCAVRADAHQGKPHGHEQAHRQNTIAGCTGTRAIGSPNEHRRDSPRPGRARRARRHAHARARLRPRSGGAPELRARLGRCRLLGRGCARRRRGGEAPATPGRGHPDDRRPDRAGARPLHPAHPAGQRRGRPEHRRRDRRLRVSRAAELPRLSQRRRAGRALRPRDPRGHRRHRRQGRVPQVRRRGARDHRRRAAHPRRRRRRERRDGRAGDGAHERAGEDGAARARRARRRQASTRRGS